MSELDDNDFPQFFWEKAIELNDKMSNDFFNLKCKYGQFDFANKFIENHLGLTYDHDLDGGLLELNYYKYDENESSQLYLFDLSRQMYIGDAVYNAFQKLVLDFIVKSVQLEHYERVIPLLTSLNRVLIFWGNTLDLTDMRNAYKVLCRKAHQQINICQEKLQEYGDISAGHQKLARSFSLSLYEVDSKIRQVYYNIED